MSKVNCFFFVFPLYPVHGNRTDDFNTDKLNIESCRASFP